MNIDQKETIVYGLRQVPQTAEHLLEHLPFCQVMTFTGSLGAGKTTLIRELLHKVGIQGPITSPTFTYLNLYVNEQVKNFIISIFIVLKTWRPFVWLALTNIFISPIVGPLLNGPSQLCLY